MRLDETHINELLLLPLRHLTQAVITSSQVFLQAGQSRYNHPLHLTTLGPRTSRGEAQPADTAAGPDTGRKDIIVVKHTMGYLASRKEKLKYLFIFIINITAVGTLWMEG